MTTLEKPDAVASGRLRFADFMLDVSGCVLTGASGQDVPLRRSEFILLLAFLRAPGRVLGRDHLLDAVSGRTSEPFDRTIDTLVSRLRRKIETDPQSPRLIVTVPGLGYKFTAKPFPAEHLPLSATGLPDKPSIAVLPFRNMSDDPGQDYFADGTTEEMITALSRIPSFFVVSRHSTFAYKGNSPDVREVGRKLGVRYVLEGSVRRSSDRVRIAAQLVDASTGAHLWADRFDIPAADIFDAQDAITASVVGAIEPKLLQAEIEQARRKPSDSLQTYDLLLRSRFIFTQQTKGALEESVRLLQRAVELDPNYPLALAWLARAQFNMDVQHFRFPSAGEVDRYVRIGQRAVGLGQDDPEVLIVASMIIGLPGGDLAEASGLVDRALGLNPNSTEGWAMSGMLHAYMGEGETALRQLDRSVRLSPLNPWVSWQGHAFTLAYFAAGRYEDALVSNERLLRRNADHVIALKYKAAALGLLGQIDEARQVVDHLLRLLPGLSLSRLRDIGAVLFKYSRRWPAVGDAQLEGLRRAGLPESALLGSPA